MNANDSLLALNWVRHRTSAPRTRTWHRAQGFGGIYHVEQVGKVYTADFIEHGEKMPHFIGAYKTLKEAKRECQYHDRRK